MNQRPTTTSAIASIPSVRTIARALVSIPAGGPRYADVQERTSRSTRSGAASASAIPTIPPSETPQSETRSSLELVEEREQTVRERLHRARQLGERRRAVAGMVVREDAEVLGERGELPLPQLLGRAERVGQHEDRRAVGAVEAVIETSSLRVLVLGERAVDERLGRSEVSGGVEQRGRARPR